MAETVADRANKVQELRPYNHCYSVLTFTVQVVPGLAADPRRNCALSALQELTNRSKNLGTGFSLEIIIFY